MSANAKTIVKSSVWTELKCALCTFKEQLAFKNAIGL